MSSVYLPVFVQNALEDNLEMLPAIHRGASLRSVLAFCQNFRIAAIGKLLIGGSPAQFRHHLHQSGRAFAHFLASAPEDAKLGSKTMPFFDAVAAGDLEAAEIIARHSRRGWRQGKEYPEDFYFPEFLMQHAFLGAPVAEREAMLQRYEQALEGSEDLRLDVCQALLAGDSDAFDEALRLYLESRNDEWAELVESETLAPEAAATEGHVSVEGLALVRLAERQGLRTEPDYLHVPSLGRRGRAPSFEADSWLRIDVAP
ncbi:MAG TPA: immunity 49 family protein [Myxococcaceae bacterium]|nr:immunity 49 family protein [Myxococcaceae bacterium]